jgi:hypothetical protein
VTDAEQGGGFPDFPMPSVDWSQMEQLANGAKPEDIASGHSEHVVLSEAMIANRITWDVAPHELFEKVAGYLGLPVGSEDVLDAEHHAAHDRLNSVLMVAPPMDVLSRLAARTVLATMLVMNDQTEELTLDSEEFEDSVEKLEVVIFNATLATIAELVDWGLLHTPHVFGTVGASNPEAMEKISEAIRTAVEQATKDIEDKGE